jgi:hypothetical protein
MLKQQRQAQHLMHFGEGSEVQGEEQYGEETFQTEANIGKVKGRFMQSALPDKQFLKESNRAYAWFLE